MSLIAPAPIEGKKLLVKLPSCTFGLKGSGSGLRNATKIQIIEAVCFIPWALILYVINIEVTGNLNKLKIPADDIRRACNWLFIALFLTFGTFIHLFFILCSGIQQKNYRKLMLWIFFNLLFVFLLAGAYILCLFKYTVLDSISIALLGLIIARHYIISMVVDIAREISDEQSNNVAKNNSIIKTLILGKVKKGKNDNLTGTFNQNVKIGMKNQQLFAVDAGTNTV